LPARAADDIVIGFATAQSGFIQPYDSDGVKMAELWIDQTNAKGGLLGKKLRAVFADTKSDRVEGAKAGQAVLNDGAVVDDSIEYDKSLCAGFEWRFPMMGGKIAGKDTFKNG